MSNQATDLPQRRHDDGDNERVTLMDRWDNIRRRPVEFQYVLGAWAAIVAVAFFSLYVQHATSSADSDAASERLAAIQYTEQLREYQSCLNLVEVRRTIRGLFSVIVELPAVASTVIEDEFKDLLDTKYPPIDLGSCGGLPVFDPRAEIIIPAVTDVP